MVMLVKLLFAKAKAPMKFIFIFRVTDVRVLVLNVGFALVPFAMDVTLYFKPVVVLVMVNGIITEVDDPVYEDICVM
jgi:hypothetical protein